MRFFICGLHKAIKPKSLAYTCGGDPDWEGEEARGYRGKELREEGRKGEAQGGSERGGREKEATLG